MKRLTETDKWEDPWVKRLPPISRVFWLYLIDKCDCAGIWEEDFETASEKTGFEMDREQILSDIDSRIERLDDERLIWLKGFIEFQNPTLSRKANVQKTLWRKIDKYGLLALLPDYYVPESEKAKMETIPLIPGENAVAPPQTAREAPKRPPTPKPKPKKDTPYEKEAAEVCSLWNQHREALGFGDCSSTVPSGRAMKNIKKVLTGKDYSLEELRVSVEQYFVREGNKASEARYVKACANFFGQDRLFLAFITPMAQLPKVGQQASIVDRWKQKT